MSKNSLELKSGYDENLMVVSPPPERQSRLVVGVCH
jgi:hypothetical protein